MSVEEKFLAAVNVIENLPTDGTFQPSEDLLLKLYAYYRQATEGPCKISKPSIWHYSSRVKWNAWNELENMEKETAMEKYVEELQKVIETMSYNENVSKFMSLIGPFYEVVPSEEIDQLSEKKSNKKTTEYLYPVKELEDMQGAKIEHSSKKCIIKDDIAVSFPNNPHSRSSKQLTYDVPLGSQRRKCIPRQRVINMFKTKNNLKHQHFGSHKDLLILTIINLQNSLEDIVRKLDNLHFLAKSADFNLEVGDEDQTSTEWNLGYSGTAFALLWPIAIHLCTRNF